MQMQDELQAAVTELEAILGGAHAVAQPDHNGYNELPENAIDEHAGLGFRCWLPCTLPEPCHPALRGFTPTSKRS